MYETETNFRGVLSAALVLTSLPMSGLEGLVAKAALPDATVIALPQLTAKKAAAGLQVKDLNVKPKSINYGLRDTSTSGLSISSKEGLTASVNNADNSFTGMYYIDSENAAISNLDFAGTDPFAFSFSVKCDTEIPANEERTLLGMTDEQYGISIRNDCAKIYAKVGSGNNTKWVEAKKTVETSGNYWASWKRIVAAYYGGKFYIAIEGEEDGKFTDTGSNNDSADSIRPVKGVPFAINYNYSKEEGLTPDRTNRFSGSLKDVTLYADESVPAITNDTTIAQFDAAVASEETDLNLDVIPEYTVNTVVKQGDLIMNEDDILQKDLPYTLEITLTASKDFVFAEDALPTSMEVTTDSGRETSVFDSVSLSEDGKTVTLTRTRAFVDHPVESPVVNIYRPDSVTVGQELPQPTDAGSDEYNIESYQWTDEEGLQAETYTSEKDYTLEVTLVSTAETGFDETSRDNMRFNLADALVGSVNASAQVRPDSVELTAEGKLVCRFLFAREERTITYLAGDVAEDGSVELSDAEKIYFDGVDNLCVTVLLKYTAIENKNYALFTLTDGGENYLTVWNNPAAPACSYYTASAGCAAFWISHCSTVTVGEYYKLVYNITSRKTGSGEVAFATKSENSEVQGGHASRADLQRFLYTQEGDIYRRWQVSQVLIGKKPAHTLTVAGDFNSNQGAAGEVVDCDENVEIKYVEVTNERYDSETLARNKLNDTVSVKEDLEAYMEDLPYAERDYTTATWTAYAAAKAKAEEAITKAGSSDISTMQKEAALCDAYEELKDAEEKLEPLIENTIKAKLSPADLTGSADSEEKIGEGANGPAALAVDGDYETYWHTQYNNPDTRVPENNVKISENQNNNYYIRLKNPAKVNGITYIPYVSGYSTADRTTFGNNGIIHKFKVYTSSSESTSAPADGWNEASDVEFTYSHRDEWGTLDQAEKVVDFSQPAESVRWIKITVTDTYGAATPRNFINAREFGVLTDSVISSNNDVKRAKLADDLIKVLEKANEYHDEGNSDTKYTERDYFNFELCYHDAQSTLLNIKNLTDEELDAAMSKVTALDAAINLLDPVIDSVSLSVTAPMIGQAPVDADLLDSTTRYSVTSTTWTKVGSSHEESVTTFEAGETYKAQVLLTAGEGQTFGESSKITSADLPGIQSVVSTLGEPASTMTVVYTFKAVQIGAVDITMTQPIVGQDVTDAILGESAAGIYSLKSTIWTRSDADSDPVAKFETGGTYKATVILETEGDYRFAETIEPPAGTDLDVSEDGRTVTIVYTYQMDAQVRWDDPQDTVALTGAEKGFFDNIAAAGDVAIDIVFKYGEAPSGDKASDIVSLLTLSDDEKHHLTLWHKAVDADGSTVGRMGYEGTGYGTGQVSFSNASTRVTDSLWKKMTVIFHRDADGSYDMYTLMNGKTAFNSDKWDVEDGAFNGKVMLDHFLSANAGSNYKITNVAFGGLIDGASYQHTDMKALNGSIKYVSIKSVADAVTTRTVDHQAVSEQASVEYKNLLAECDALNEAEFDNGAWTTFQGILGANKDKTTEWEVYNAIDAIRAALDDLKKTSKCTCTVSEPVFTIETPIDMGEELTKNIKLTATATGSAGTEPSKCQVEGHEDSDVVYTYKLADDSGENAKITGDILTVTGTGKVSVEVTAKFNNAESTETATAMVTNKAFQDLQAAIQTAKTEYPDEQEEDFSADYWQEFEDALAAAEALVKKDTLKNSEIAKATAAINDAMQQLKDEAEGKEIPNFVRWDSPESGEITLSSNDKTFFKNLRGSDIAVDIVLRYDEDGIENTKLCPLITFTDGTNNNLMLYHAAFMPGMNNRGGMAFMTPETDAGWRFSSEAAYVDDTKWHKLTYILARQKQNGVVTAGSYIFNGLIDDRGSIMSKTDRNESWDLATDARRKVVEGLLNKDWTTSSVYIGAPVANVAYPALQDSHFPAMGAFNGEIAYVTVRKIDFNTDTFYTDHSAIGEDILEQYNTLKGQCQALDENIYTEESWTALETALALPTTTEWDVYNAIDSINAAKEGLQVACKCTVALENGFTLEDIVLNTGETEKSIDLKEKAHVASFSSANCPIEAHKTTAAAKIEYTTDGGAGSTITDNILKVTAAGKVTVTATAIFNDARDAKTATMSVMTQALSEFKTYLNGVEEQYPDQGDYTDSSWEALTDAIDDARALLEESTVSDDEIAAAKQAIEAAKGGLKTKAQAAREELQTLYNTVAELAQNKDDYDLDSWNELEAAHQAAKAVLDNENADEAALKNAFENLEAAKSGLKTKWQETQEQIDDLREVIGDENQYTPESWEEVKDVLGQIDELNSKWSQSGHSGLTADAYKSQLEGLLGKLQGAKDKLVKTEDEAVVQARKKLQEALDEMQAILGAGQCDYSDDTWEAFRNAYLAAKNPGSNPTVEKLEQLLEDLRKAREALAKPSTTDKKPQDQGGQKPPAGDNLPKEGSQHTVGKLVYQVKTSTASSKTVMVVKATSKTQKKITIPATVKIGGQAYKVVEIKANAFAKSKKLTTVKIGANVTKIGKKAFFKCAKLKKVTIKAKGLKTIGKQAFAKINRKARIRVPKKQLKTLQKKLKKAKTAKSVKITK